MGISSQHRNNAQPNKTKHQHRTHPLTFVLLNELLDWEVTFHRCAGFVDQTVALDDAVREVRLPPGHVDRGGGQLTKVDETGSAGSWKEAMSACQMQHGGNSVGACEAL